ncbi:hypothetical protein [Sulfurimonas sp.]|uniref:hypothetical protein n=1 Tax=Sulfurimonas sp. TaxID=2022749 RepID=UPI0026226AC1|nr:hypothetical protein [Sulfurimonas sp.]
MKALFLICLLFVFGTCSNGVKHSFANVWSQLESDPYIKLPQTEVSYFKLSKDGENIILENAIRTLNDDSDLLEPFEKLAHPNGICFKGVWKIEKENPYGGYFKKGSESLIIARASTAMSHTKSSSTRAFGFAGKLFGTMNPQQVNVTPSANFFLIDDLGGTDAAFYRDVSLINEPSVSITYEVVKNLAYAMKVSSSFSEANKNPTIRQLYEISYMGEDSKEGILTPKWMKIEISKSNVSNAKDFRDELKIEDGQELVFDISVSSEIIDEKRVWQKIGKIILDTSVVSESCDKRLHFHHPKFRDNL